NLKRYDALWVGYGANLQGNDGLSHFNENAIRHFVARGGVVVAFAPNTRPARGNKLSWVPDPLVVSKDRLDKEGGDPTLAGIPYFRAPHAIAANQLKPTVWWSDWSDRYSILAHTTVDVRGDKQEVSAAMLLPYGQGLYVVMGFGPESPSDLSWSFPLAQNILHQVIEWKEKRETQQFVA
ncbi:MAG: hypothetical protein O3A46_06065, partial [Candidatus Poribacteria bacterium]|nr:hypothetical protein [Candidatus Poribacteria bacterium]